jgi:hypothetical protein
MEEIKIKPYRVKKLFKGFASVRDYVVKGCVKKNQVLKILFNDRYMLVPTAKLEQMYQLHSSKFQSKYGNKTYELIDFMFIPTVTSSKQQVLW